MRAQRPALLGLPASRAPEQPQDTPRDPGLLGLSLLSWGCSTFAPSFTPFPQEKPAVARASEGCILTRRSCGEVGVSWPQAPHMKQSTGRAAPTPRAPRLAALPPKKGTQTSERKCFMSGLGPAGSSAAHSDPPGVGAQHTLPPAHHARVRALVDGVGDDAQVRLAQRQVAGVGELQGFLVLVPAVGSRAQGWAGSRVPAAHPPWGGHRAGPLTTLCLSCAGSSGHSGRSRSGPRAPAWSWFWAAARWQPRWGRETLQSGGRGRAHRGPQRHPHPPRPTSGQSRPAAGLRPHRSRSHSCWGRASS